MCVCVYDTHLDLQRPFLGKKDVLELEVSVADVVVVGVAHGAHNLVEHITGLVLYPCIQHATHIMVSQASLETTIDYCTDSHINLKDAWAICISCCRWGKLNWPCMFKLLYYTWGPHLAHG